MKFKWRILALTLIAAMVTISQPINPIAAQDGEDDDPNVIAVQAASVEHIDDQFVFTINGEQLDGCEFELETTALWQSQTVLFIDIVRVEDETTPVACSSERPTFSIELVLDAYEPSDDAEVVDETPDEIGVGEAFPVVTVVINDFVGQFPLVNIIARDGPDVTNFRIVEMTASLVNIDEAGIEYDEETEQYVLSVNGSFPEGCEAPVIIRQDQAEQTLNVEIFRPIPIDAICPFIFLTYEDTITLEGEFSGIMTIAVNELPIVYDADTNTQIGVESMTPIPTVIEDVNVRVLESFPPQLDIHVTGYHPDSCDFPVQIDTRVNGNTITVEIYREVPPNVRCGEPTVPYETNFNLGSFDPGDYIIDVNGTIIEITL